MVHEPVFETFSDRLPPQNVDAEEAILGGILLDPEAIGRVAEILKTEAFYISAHQEIYKAALDLFGKGLPTDLMRVTTWLKDQGLLEKVGGQGRLIQLVDRTVSAVNIDQYAQLVMDKYLRRKLIRVGQEISQTGYDTTLPLESVLDKSEQKLFAITQDRPTQGLTATADILISTFADIENRAEGLVLPGIPSGFYDLDAMTQGFQRSDLIIAAGRPSMGKTSFVLNIARNIAGATPRLPVAVFSLEMSKDQLVYRLLSSEALIESGRLRSGRVSQREWQPLSHAINTLSQLPVFIDDTPNISVNEMRSKARRLQAEQGGALGLILIDYLQLMESSGSDNRVQELSRVTRSLKGLARELNVPIIALSQLSRGVESRTNKRPMMSDLRECVTGDTLVWLADGRRLPIADLVGQTPEVISMNAQGRLLKAQTDLIWEVGTKPIFALTTASGRKIRATGKHRLYTFDGWQQIQALKVGDRLAVANHMPRLSEPINYWLDSRVKGISQRRMATLRGTSYGGTAHFKFAPSKELLLSYAEILDSTELREIATSDIFWDEIVSIEPAGEEVVYDLTVPGPASWIADGIVSHNSGSIEQDADLILMLYRDEYYNPDTPDRGIAEIIITKHRNGPVGTVKMLFEQQFTRFRNLAAPPQNY
ncbi:MAG: replicative DNA helicase [Synechococcales bacterium]|nr:replicative DNA helicase [Synechococcales bacterium]